MTSEPGKTTLTFISRHYPPNININGESVWDMVKFLEEKYGVKSNILCIGRDFEGGGQQREPAGNVIRLKTIYEGKNPLLRFFTMFYDGYILTRKALKYKDTILVFTTSPPLLPMWASMMLSSTQRWAIWFFDLFPEGLAVTGRIKEKNLFYRFMFRHTYRIAPTFMIALGPQQAKHLSTKYGKEVPTLVLPCGVFFYQEKSETPPSWWRQGLIYLGYCGNVNDAHNPDFIKAAIDNIDPDKHRLVLALYGSHAAGLKEYARNRAGVVLVDNVPRSQLHFIDVHLVSLRREWTHIAVPSKAISAVSLGSAILFCGSEESDNWFLLQKAGWLIEEDSSLVYRVKRFLDTLTMHDIAAKKLEAPAIYEQLKTYVSETYREMGEKGQG